MRRFFFALSIFALSWSLMGSSQEWSGDLGNYRIPVTIKVPAPGKYMVPMDKEVILKGINALETFSFKEENFAYPTVKLFLNGKMVQGRFVIMPQRELIQNGRFATLKPNGTPDKWTFSSNAAVPKFTIAPNPDGKGNTISASGADRHSMFQNVTLKPRTWYRFTTTFKGISHPHVSGVLYNLKSAGNFPTGHVDVAVGGDALNTIDTFFYSGDNANWVSNRFSVSIVNFPTEVHSVSLQECQVEFVADFASAGDFSGHWYYTPLEGRHGHAPEEIATALPASAVQATISGEAERLDATFRLASTDGGLFWSAPTTMKLPRNARPGKATGTLRLFAARNESEAIQIVFSPEKDGRLEAFTAEIEGIPAASLSFHSPQYVNIAAPSSHASGIMVIPHRSTFTGLLPDPMPVFAPTPVKQGENQLLWLDVAVPKDAAPGIHKGKCTIQVNGQLTTLPLELQVADFTLPDKPSFETMLAFSQYANLRLFPFHGVTSRADKYELSRRYIAEMAKYKMNVKLPTAAGVYNPEKNIRTNTPAGMVELYRVELPWALGKLGLRHYIVNHFSGRARHTPESAAKAAAFTEAIASELEKDGLLDGAMMWVDEPMISEYKYVKILRDAYQKTPHASKIPFVTATYHEYAYTQLQGLTDVIAILISDANGVSRIGRKLWGERPLWTYLTRSSALWIDAPGLDNRFMALRNWASDSTGMLIWGTNCWWSSDKSPHKQFNPWENPASTWGNGALAFFYPPIRTGNTAATRDMTITPSLRLILYRDGIEDFEYAHILDSLNRSGKLPPSEKAEAERLLAELHALFPTPASWSLNECQFAKLRVDAGTFIAKCQKYLK